MRPNHHYYILFNPSTGIVSKLLLCQLAGPGGCTLTGARTHPNLDTTGGDSEKGKGGS